jgi:phenylalanyl-tRNA synthetase alpha chain
MIFADLGFQVYRTREVVTDEMNSELLNMPARHPEAIRRNSPRK